MLAFITINYGFSISVPAFPLPKNNSRKLAFIRS